MYVQLGKPRGGSKGSWIHSAGCEGRVADIDGGSRGQPEFGVFTLRATFTRGIEGTECAYKHTRGEIALAV